MAPSHGRWFRGWVVALIGFALLAVPVQVATASLGSGVGESSASHGEYLGGQVRFTPKANWADCQDGNVCLYSHQQFSGDLVQFSSCCTWINLADYNFANTTASWRDRRNNDSLLATGQDGNGNHLCLDNNDADGTMTDAWRNVASSVRNRDVSDLC